MDKLILNPLEELAFAMPEGQQKQAMLTLLSEVRKLQHALDDPEYMYSGRIPRHAILSRNAEIDELRAEVKRLKTPSKPG